MNKNKTNINNLRGTCILKINFNEEEMNINT